MKLFYFTHSFPYGLGEQWKVQELNVLRDHFDEITVIPFTYAGNTNNPRILSSGIKVSTPLFPETVAKFNVLRVLRQLLASPMVFLSEVFAQKLYANKNKMAKALHFLSEAHAIKSNPVFSQLLRASSVDTYWFFYWGRGTADVIPFLKSFNRKKVAVRLHGYDIFEFRSDNYIPFRKAFYNNTDVIFSVSEFGRDYLEKRYPHIRSKLKISRLGTKSAGLSRASEDGVFSIVSCSSLISLKRMDLLMATLARITEY
jgi:hypothetical protein